MTHKFLSKYSFVYSSLHVSSRSCSSSGETNCINTDSGNCHSVLVAVSCAGWEFTPNQKFLNNFNFLCSINYIFMKGTEFFTEFLGLWHRVDWQVIVIVSVAHKCAVLLNLLLVFQMVAHFAFLWKRNQPLYVLYCRSGLWGVKLQSIIFLCQFNTVNCCSIYEWLSIILHS